MSSPFNIAIFDLDHTLARRDTYLRYLWGYLWRRPWRAWRCAFLPCAIALFAMGQMSNASLKEYLLSAILGGASRQDIDEWTQSFLRKMIPGGLSREGLRVLEVHRRSGDHLVLLSASPDCYVLELGKRLMFDEVVCTNVEWRGNRLSGRLASANIRGEEKVQALLSIKSRLGNLRVTAYGDRPSDLPLLRLADRGVLVNPSSGLMKRAIREGIFCDVWFK